MVGTQRYDIGKLDVELGRNYPVLCLCLDSRNAPFQWDQRAFLGWDALIIGKDLPDGFIDQVYSQFFRRVEPIGTVKLHRGGLVVGTLSISYATHYDRLYPWPQVAGH